MLHSCPGPSRRLPAVGQIVRRASIIAVVLAMLIPTTAHGVAKSTQPPDVWLTVGVWGGWASFGASWDVTEERDAGRTWYTFRRLQMTGLVHEGKKCPSWQCEKFWASFRVQFLDSSGKVTATILPPLGTACSQFAVGKYSLHWYGCREASYSISSTYAHSIRFKWAIYVHRGDGVLLAWLAQKTVPAG